jgi:uncharacterized protein (DUF488 family)
VQQGLELAMSDVITIYTIGHSRHPAETFLALLRDAGIQTIVDVRSRPVSRFAPYANRGRLEPLLAESGIAYHYAGDDLGGRPSDPALYKNGVVPRGKADYLALVDYPAITQLDSFKQEVDRVLEIARGSPTALLCSEEDPFICHRHHLIEPAMRDRGVQVLHIRKDGRLDVSAPARSKGNP